MPPSAWITSQSIHTVRSPSSRKLTTERSDRPTRRWISTVRPSCLPRVASRCLRSPVEPGSIPYSDVTQPVPRPRIHGGTDSSTIAVQMSRVEPISKSTEPVADEMKSSSILIGPQLVGRAPVGARHAATARTAGSTRSTSVSGSWRNRPATSRNAAGSPVHMKR